MSTDSPYSLLPEDDHQTGPAFSPRQMDEIQRLMYDFDGPKRKKNKKKDKGKGKKKGKTKKLDKALADLFNSSKKSKKKSKGKKAKGKKSKSKTQSERKLKNQLIVMTAEKSLDTVSYGDKRYCDHKWPVVERDAKAK